MPTIKKTFLYNGSELTYKELKTYFPKISFPPEKRIKQGNFDPSWGVTVKITEIPDYVPTLEELKAKKLTLLERAFDRRVSGSFVCSLGYAMQFNRSDCIAVEGAVKLLDATGETEGYLTDAEDVTHYGVSKEQMNAVLVEMMKAYAAYHADKQTLRAAINACETAEALDGVAFEWSIDKEEDQ